MNNMDEFKTCLLDILSWFHQICVENNLRYYLVEGTMLGAARHQGFIPWDDDIDVGMPREDYEKLKMNLGDKVHQNRFLLETEDSIKPEYYYPFGKIYDVTTTLIENRKSVVTRGVYIDIFPLDGLAQTEREANYRFRRIGILHDILTSRVVVQRSGRKWYKNLAVKAFQALPSSLFDEKRLLKQITELCKQKSFDECAYGGNLVSTYRAKEIMPISYYGTPTLYKFEHLNVYGVENYDAYLSHLYGAWRELPPDNMRVSAHVRENVDLHKPFIRY